MNNKVLIIILSVVLCIALLFVGHELIVQSNMNRCYDKYDNTTAQEACIVIEASK